MSLVGIKKPLRIGKLSGHLSVEMANKDADDRLTSFLNLLLGVDSGAMVYLLITHYKPGGFKLPATLPTTISPAHHELSFFWQVLVLAACAGAILIIHAFRLWMHQSQRYQEGIRKIAVLILAATLLAIFQAGYKILKDPRLLKGGEQMQKSNE